MKSEMKQSRNPLKLNSGLHNHYHKGTPNEEKTKVPASLWLLSGISLSLLVIFEFVLNLHFFSYFVVIFLPFELAFVKWICLKIYPAVISFTADRLEIAKDLHHTDRILINLDDLYAKKSGRLQDIITLDHHHKLIDETLDSAQPLYDKNSFKLLQVAALCRGESEKNLPKILELLEMTPEDLNLKWPLIRKWQIEDICFSKHKEVKTHMTQILCAGSTEAVLERCTHVLTQNGIDILKKEHVAKIITDERRHNSRFWAYAFKVGSDDSDDPADLIYIGSLGIEHHLIDMDISLFDNHSCILFSSEPPTYAQKLAGQFFKEPRLLDRKKFRSMTNKELYSILDRYVLFTRMDSSDRDRLFSLYRKKNLQMLHTFKGGDAIPEDFHMREPIQWSTLNQNISDSSLLEIRFSKATRYVISMHLIEALILPLLISAPAWSVALINLATSLLLGGSLFWELPDNRQRLSKFSTVLIGGLIACYLWIVSRSVSPNEFLLLMIFGLLSVSMMIQNPLALSLRQISFKRTPLYGSVGFIIVLSLIFYMPLMHLPYNFERIIRLFTLGIVPMLLHDMYKLTRLYIGKIKSKFFTERQS